MQGTKLLASNIKRALFGPRKSTSKPSVSRPIPKDYGQSGLYGNVTASRPLNNHQGELYSNETAGRSMNNNQRFIPGPQYQRFPNRSNQEQVRTDQRFPAYDSQFNNYQAREKPFNRRNYPSQPQAPVLGQELSQQRREHNIFPRFQAQTKEMMADKSTNTIRSAVFYMLNYQ